MKEQVTTTYQINDIPIQLWQAYLNTEPRGSKRTIKDMILLDLRRIISLDKKGSWKR